MIMEPEFDGRPLTVPKSTDLDQMPDTTTHRSCHRRAHSETFFHFPDLDDDLNLDLPQNPPPTLPPCGPPGPLPKPVSHFRSFSTDAGFFDGRPLDAPPALAPAVPKHDHSNSVDGYSSATSSEVDSSGKNAMPADRLQELSLIDPRRAKRILANRQSAARSKERKTRYTNDLEKKLQTLQSEATKLSAQITVLQRDTTGLTSENKELKLRLQALEQQAQLRDALNDALRDELKWFKIASGQVQGVNGNNRGLPSPFPCQPATFHYLGNHQGQRKTSHSSPITVEQVFHPNLVSRTLISAPSKASRTGILSR